MKLINRLFAALTVTAVALGMATSTSAQTKIRVGFSAKSGTSEK